MVLRGLGARGELDRRHPDRGGDNSAGSRAPHAQGRAAERYSWRVGVGAGAAARGSWMVNVVPAPSRLCTEMTPRWARTMARAMARPSPDPSVCAARRALLLAGCT